jgi:protease I
MADMKLQGKKIALFVAPLFEDLELWYPYYRLQEEGAEVVVIGPEKTRYTGKHGVPVESSLAISETRAIEFDALVIPGGYSPDHMRRNPAMVEFVREMDKQRKPVAAICHGPWMLASADIVKGRRVTSFFAIKDDLVHAGAEWVDIKVVKNENLITSRVPDDLPAFCTAIIEVLSTASIPAD